MTSGVLCGLKLVRPLPSVVSLSALTVWRILYMAGNGMALGPKVLSNSPMISLALCWPIARLTTNYLMLGIARALKRMKNWRGLPKLSFSGVNYRSKFEHGKIKTR